MKQDAQFARYRPLKFEVPGSLRGGDRYVVHREYRLPGGDPCTVSIAVFTEPSGASARLLPGEGPFESGTRILEPAEGPPNGLGIAVGHDRTGKCEIVRCLMLRGA